MRCVDILDILTLFFHWSMSYSRDHDQRTATKKPIKHAAGRSNDSSCALSYPRKILRRFRAVRRYVGLCNLDFSPPFFELFPFAFMKKKVKKRSRLHRLTSTLAVQSVYIVLFQKFERSPKFLKVITDICKTKWIVVFVTCLTWSKFVVLLIEALHSSATTHMKCETLEHHLLFNSKNKHSGKKIDYAFVRYISSEIVQCSCVWKSRNHMQERTIPLWSYVVIQWI